MSALAVLRRRPAAWQHQPFRRLLPAWVSTNLADSALYLSVAVWVKDLTGSDAAAAIVFAALGLANLTGPLMGHLVDRVSRRPVMIVANLVGAALVAALRLLGTGVGGLEPMFFLLVLAGASLGPSLGFTLGALAMLVSALLTAGVGPWLPFQAFAAAGVGAGAGLVGRVVLPRDGARPGRRAVVVLAVYGVVAAYLYGLVTNLWFWPFALGDGTQLSYAPGGGLSENLPRFLAYTLATSTLTVDSVRAVVTAGGVLVLGKAVLGALGRARTHGCRALPTGSAGRDAPAAVRTHERTHLQR